MKKRIMAVALIIALSFCLVSTDYRRAEASALGIPILYIIDLILSSVCVTSGVSLSMDNWHDISTDLIDAGRNASNSDVKDWFKDLYNMAHNPSNDTTLAVALDGVGAISQLDLTKYIVPIGAVLSLLPVVKTFIVQFLCNKFGLGDKLEVGQKEISIGEWAVGSPQYVMIQNALQYYSSLQSQYPYMLITQNVTNASSGLAYVIFMAQTPLYISFSKSTSLYKCIVLRGNTSGISIKYAQLKPGQKFTDKGIVESIAPIEQSWAFCISEAKDPIYANSDVFEMVQDYNDRWNKTTNVIIHKTEQVFKTVPATSIDVPSNADLDVIPISSGLASNISKINIDDIKNTDDLFKSVSNTVIGSKEKTVTDIWDKIADLPGTIAQGVTTGLTKVFVPDATKVDVFVAEATKTVENKGGILTYPIELVIKFLMAVNKLGVGDCIIEIPKIQYKGYILYAGMQYNYSEYIRKSEFNDIYTTYKLITNYILIIGVIALAIKKGKEIITGGILNDSD